MGSEILILGGDIRSRSWPNIGDSYGKLLKLDLSILFVMPIELVGKIKANSNRYLRLNVQVEIEILIRL